MDLTLAGKRAFGWVEGFFFAATLAPPAAAFLAADLGGAAAGVTDLVVGAGFGAYEY